MASGAVLRALDKKNGPERISQSSYGFLRHEPWQPRLYSGHERAKPDESELDGEKYVATIDYFMIKVIRRIINVLDIRTDNQIGKLNPSRS